MIEPRRPAEFEEFYRAHWGRLAGAMRLMSGDAMTADEIAQDAFAKAWAHWPRVSQLERPEGWLYVTAFRLCRRRLKREAHPAAAEPAATEATVDVNDRVSLQRALAVLPLRQRQAVIARHVLGLNGPEAADLLGMRPDNFRQVLSKAMHALRVSPDLQEGT